jgi:hemolysin activation/secretion protein
LGIITQPYELDEAAIKQAYEKDVLDAILSTPSEDSPVPPLPLGDYFALDENGNFDHSRVYMPHMAAGVGVKVAMNENFVLSVDWAMALDKQDNAKWANFYIKMGYLF